MTLGFKIIQDDIQSMIYDKQSMIFIFFNLLKIDYKYIRQKMGNNINPLPSLTACNKSSLKYDEYDFIQKLSQNKYLMKHKQSKQLSIIIQNTFPSQQQLNDYIRRYKNQSTIVHQFYQNVLYMEIVSNLNICSKQFKMYEYYAYQVHDLQKEIQMRRGNKKYFDYQEIISILCSCVLVMAYFCKNQVLHYTLNPSDIIITEDGACKVISSRLSNFIFDFNEKRQFYYSPQTLKMFKQQSLTGLTNKSGVFTLGISLLSMIHLRHMYHLYNYDTYTINLELMHQEVNKVKHQLLQKILVKMLKIQTYQRISFVQLQEMLFQFICKDNRIENNYGRSYNDEQAQKYQIAKLEQSITKLHIQEGGQSNSTSKLTKRTILPLNDSKNTYLPIRQSKMSRLSFPQSKISHIQHQDHFYRPNQDNLIADDEDYPNSQYYYSNIYQSLIDHQILDQFQNLAKNQFFNTQRSSRNILQERSIEDILACNPKISQKQLSSAKNKLKSHQQSSYRSNFQYNQQQKQNLQIPNYIDCSKKNKAHQCLPQYISQVLPQGRYEGYKVNNERHGFGTFYYNQGGRYCGEWASDKMQGRGVLYYASGKIAYEGQWKNDRLEGYGTLYNQIIGIQTQENDYTHLQLIGDNWIKYEGTFKDDLKKGQGILYLSNGQNYLGSFQGDQPHGLGHFTNIRGQTIRGYWLMGALNTIQ